MAKTKPTETDAYQELLDLLTDEEKENLARLTGQGNGGGTKTPIVKINYKERADLSGNKVPKGNFVLGQSSKTVDGKKVLEHAGTDLGEKLNCVILKVGTQYSFWSEDPKKRCSSQIICERGEVPTGYNYKSVCNDKSCARRKDGLEKGDRCINQHVVYLRLPAGTKLPDGTDCPIAMFYVKGTSYKAFQDYINEGLKGIPTIAVTTKFSTEEDEQGATVFYRLKSDKGEPVPAAVFKENFQLVTGVNKQLLEFKNEQQKKLTAKPDSTSSQQTGEKTTIVVNNGGDTDNVEW